MAVTEIIIDTGETPVCLCGGNTWNVKVRIENESPLIRVDKFACLVREAPDPLLYQQAVAIECLDCGQIYQPVGGVSAKLELEGNKIEPVVEAYSEGKQKQLPDGDWSEQTSGLEDGFGFGPVVPNETEWTD